MISLFFALLSVAGTADAQEFEQPNNIEVELVAERAPTPGGTVMLALHFQPVSVEWHGYWANPGDAGRGMQLDWRLPESWEVGEPLYPVPQRLEIAGLMNHIYEGDYAVLLELQVPLEAAVANFAPIALTVEYLACTDKICVPQSAQVELQWPASGNDPRFADWRGRIAPLIDSEAGFEVAGKRLRIGIPLPASAEVYDPHLFVENDALGEARPDYIAVQTFIREGDLLVAEIPIDGRAGDSLPEQVQGILSFGMGEGVRFVAKPADVPLEGVKPIAGPGVAAPFWLLIGGALLGGLILNIMPCVFPILSLKALALAKSGVSERAARLDGLAYTAGAVVAALGLGAVLLLLRSAGENVGWAFQLQEPGVVVALLILASTLTANFAGLFELPNLPIRAGGEPAGAFGTGLLAAFVATPCTGPFMAAALGAALLLPTFEALMLFGALGLGLALPFLALGLIPSLRSRLPRPGPWMEVFRRWMALPMGLTALALVWLTARLGGQGFALMALVVVFGIVLALAIVGKLQARGKLAWPAFALVAAPFAIFGAFAVPAAYAEPDRSEVASVLEPVAFSEAALAKARASGKPVFVWFTADWCLTCKVNERVAIEREGTRATFEDAGVIAMRGDWTVRDEEITRFLSSQGVAGVPLYLWYEPGQDAEQLSQVLTPAMLEERAARAR